MITRLGDDIDDFCVKCKRITNHAIVSLVEDAAAILGKRENGRGAGIAQRVAGKTQPEILVVRDAPLDHARGRSAGCLHRVRMG